MGNPAGPGGSLTSKPTWWNTFGVFHHVGFFFERKNGSGDDAKTRSSSVESKPFIEGGDSEFEAVIRREVAGRAIRVVPVLVVGIRIIPATGGSLTEVRRAFSPSVLGFDMAPPSTLIRPTERFAL